MKYIKIFYLFLLAHQLCAAMEQPEFTLGKPYFDSQKKEYVIEAFGPTQEKVGWVYYHPTQARAWQMRELFVDCNYRKKGIARTLLQKCIENIKECSATELSWQVYPKTIGMTEEQLVTIYFNMLLKIDPKYAAHTINEIDGNEYCSISRMILNLE